jgi:type 2A phosphatase activator TIP41
MPEMVTTKAYDWTYTMTYAGSLDGTGSGNAQWTPSDPSVPHYSIPIAELSRPDPILLYAEIPLFDDEPRGNGASHLLVCIVGLSSSSFRTEN